MRKNILITVLALLVFVLPVLAATTDFTADGNIVVAGVTLYEGGSTDDLLILTNSTAESFNFNSAVFTVTNPGSAFQVGSSNSTVKSVYAMKSGVVVACATNPTPGTSAVTLPTTAADYVVYPSANTGFATTDCCSSVSQAATYNAFPTCGPATCNSGYYVSGASCVQIGGGGVSGSAGGGGGSAVAQIGLTSSSPSVSPSPSPSPSASPTPSPSVSPSAVTLIRYANDPKVYVVESGQKRWVQTAEDFNNLGYKWTDVKIVPTSETYPDGTVMKVPSVSSAVVLIRYANDPKVYVVENNQKRWIQTAEDFNKLGYKWSDIKTAPASETYVDGAVKTAITAIATFTKTLTRGSKGTEVLALQQKLKDLGYFPADVKIVNNFGPTTQKAVKAFQKANGLSQSGTVDAKTRVLLNK